MNIKKFIFLSTLSSLFLTGAYAVDWHVYVSTDPSDGRNQQEVVVSTSGARLNLPGATVKCDVSPVQGAKLPPHFTLEGRYLTCEFLDGSLVAQFTGCLNEVDQHSMSVLYVRNLNKIFELSVQCLNKGKKE